MKNKLNTLVDALKDIFAVVYEDTQDEGADDECDD